MKRNPTRRASVVINLMLLVLFVVVLGTGLVWRWTNMQIVADLTRVHADLRTYATALESYAIDWNGEYPPSWAEGTPGSHSISFGELLIKVVPPEERLIPLSTPLAYMNDALLTDPFNGRIGWFLYEGADVVGTLAPPSNPASRDTIYFYQSFLSPDFQFALSVFDLIASGSRISCGGFGPFLPGGGLCRYPRDIWMLAGTGPDEFYVFDACVSQGGDALTCAVDQSVGISRGNTTNVYDPMNGLESYGEVVRWHQTPGVTPIPVNSTENWNLYK